MGRRRYAILGTGAVGGFYGGLLARAGEEVHFLLHSDVEEVRRNGLLVESPRGSFHLKDVHAYGDVREMPPADVVVVSLKSTRNDLLPTLLPPMLARDGVVLLLQNGLGVEEQIAAIVGPDRVLGGLCFLCCNKVGPGRIQHIDYGLVTLAEYCADGKPGGLTERLRSVADDFERAGIEVKAVEDLVSARWHKLVWNVPFNGLSVVLDTSTDHLMSCAHSRRLVEELMHEVATAAKGFGRIIAPPFIQKMLDDTAKMKPYRTSMKLDYDEKRPMEVEGIFGNAWRAAQSVGVAAPRIESLYRMLSFLDERNTSSR